MQNQSHTLINHTIKTDRYPTIESKRQKHLFTFEKLSMQPKLYKIPHSESFTTTLTTPVSMTSTYILNKAP